MPRLQSTKPNVLINFDRLWVEVWIYVLIAATWFIELQQLSVSTCQSYIMRDMVYVRASYMISLSGAAAWWQSTAGNLNDLQGIWNT